MSKNTKKAQKRQQVQVEKYTQRQSPKIFPRLICGDATHIKYDEPRTKHVEAPRRLYVARSSTSMSSNNEVSLYQTREQIQGERWKLIPKVGEMAWTGNHLPSTREHTHTPTTSPTHSHMHQAHTPLKSHAIKHTTNGKHHSINPRSSTHTVKL